MDFKKKKKKTCRIIEQDGQMMLPDGKEAGTAAYPAVQHYENSDESTGEKDVFPFFLGDRNILGSDPTWVTVDEPRATSETELMPAGVSFTAPGTPESGTQPITCSQFSHTGNRLHWHFRFHSVLKTAHSEWGMK